MERRNPFEERRPLSEADAVFGAEGASEAVYYLEDRLFAALQIGWQFGRWKRFRRKNIVVDIAVPNVTVAQTEGVGHPCGEKGVSFGNEARDR